MLRQKVPLDGQLTDHELFKQLPLGDIWQDARLPEVFLYLLDHRSLTIPSSWYATMMELKLELEKFVIWQQFFMYCGRSTLEGTAWVLMCCNYEAKVVTASDLREAELQIIRKPLERNITLNMFQLFVLFS